MDTRRDLVDDTLSPARSRGLVVAGLVIALLGLTLLDVSPADSTRKRHASDPHSFDCIVASAVFAGVSPAAADVAP